MDTNGVLLKRLDACIFTVCVVGIYGMATKRPHKTKMVRSINQSKPVVSVRDCVSVDLLVSRTPVIIAQMSVFIVCQNYQYSFLFVDRHYYSTYGHSNTVIY